MFQKTDAEGNILRNRVTIDCAAAVEAGTEEVRTEQSHKAEVDINTIIKRHAGREDLIASTQHIQGLVFDENPSNDFQEMMNMMIRGKEAFASMPSEVRNHFGNDAAKFMDFVRDPSNEQQMIDWGLQNPPEPPPAPMQVEVVNQTTETPPEAL